MTRTYFLLLLAFWFSAECFCQVPGSLDTSFGNNGVGTAPAPPWTNPLVMGIGQNQDIFVGTSINLDSIPYFYLTRFDQNGQLITSFGNNGQVIVPAPMGFSFVQIRSIAPLPDGSLLLGGCGHLGSWQTQQIVLSKLRPNGTLDSSFGTNGTQISSQIRPYDYRAPMIIPKPDGKILLGCPVEGPHVMYQFLPDGSPDLDFGQSGEAYHPAGSGDITRALGIDLLPDGKILMAGEFINYGGGSRKGHMMRYNEDGSRDSSFTEYYFGSPSAYYRTEFNRVRVLANGKILLMGLARPQNSLYVFGHRLEADGAVDSTFAVDGAREVSLPSPISQFFIDPFGNSYGLGAASSLPNYSHFILKIDSNGNPDTLFGNQGIPNEGFAEYLLQYPINSGPVVRLDQLNMQSSGGLIVAGISGSTIVVFRIHNLSSPTSSEPPQTAKNPYLRVFPNPISPGGILNLSFEGNPNRPTHFSLYNQLGQMVHNWDWVLRTDPIFSLRLPEGLGAGNYVLRVKSTFGESGIQVLVR